MYVDKGQQLVRRNKAVDVKSSVQPRALLPKYKKLIGFVPKDKGPFTKAEPCPNQCEVFIALKTNGSLLRPIPMKPVTQKACKNSEQYYEYHQDYGHATSNCWALAKANKELNVVRNNPPQQGSRVVDRMGARPATRKEAPRQPKNEPWDKIEVILTISIGDGARGVVPIEITRYT